MSTYQTQLKKVQLKKLQMQMLSKKASTLQQTLEIIEETTETDLDECDLEIMAILLDIENDNTYSFSQEEDYIDYERSQNPFLFS